MLRAITSRCNRDERGLSLVELGVTMAILGIITTATLAVTMRAFKDSGIIEDRRQVFGDGQVALQRMTKQLRQADSVDEISSYYRRVWFDTYVDGTPVFIRWRVRYISDDEYHLQYSQDFGTYVTVLDSLTDNTVFTYTEHDGVLDQVTIDLSLGTKTDTVDVGTDVQLRNA